MGYNSPQSLFDIFFLSVKNTYQRLSPPTPELPYMLPYFPLKSNPAHLTLFKPQLDHPVFVWTKVLPSQYDLYEETYLLVDT